MTEMAVQYCVGQNNLLRWFGFLPMFSLSHLCVPIVSQYFLALEIFCRAESRGSWAHWSEGAVGPERGQARALTLWGRNAQRNPRGWKEERMATTWLAGPRAPWYQDLREDGCVEGPAILGPLVQRLSCSNTSSRTNGQGGTSLGTMGFSMVAILTLGRSRDIDTLCLCVPNNNWG